VLPISYCHEAIHVLRAEKGFIIVGQETDGTVTPHDLGMGWIASKQKKDFLGKRSLTRRDTARDDRKQLVGLLTENPSEVIPEGGQIVAELKEKPPMAMLGHVTSSYYSPNCNRSIALALVKNGRSRLGETVYVPLEGRIVRAKVAEPRFFDPEGKRLDGLSLSAPQPARSPRPRRPGRRRRHRCRHRHGRVAASLPDQPARQSR